MRRILPLAAVLLLGCPLAAQSLLSSVPNTVVAYARAKGGWEAFEKLAGNKALWKNPVDLDSGFFEQMDKGLDQMGSMLGIETGSMGSYLRSIKSWELVLYSADIEEGFSEIDFVVVLDTPMAKQIYELFSGILVKRAFGELSEDGDIEVELDDDFGLNIARREDKILIAGSAARLRETMSNYGQVVAGNLGQSDTFKRAVAGTSPNFVGYLDVGVLTTLVRSIFMARVEGGPGGGQPRDQLSVTTRMMGFDQIKTACWCEGEQFSRLVVGADKPVLPFEVLSAKGSPKLMGKLPANTIFAFNWTGETEGLWKVVKKRIITNSELPFAPMAAEAVRNFQKKSGLKVDELAALFDGGLAFGLVPRNGGNAGPCFIARCNDPTKAADVATTLMEKMRKRNPSGEGEDAKELVVDRGDSIWYYPQGRNRRRPPTVVIAGNDILIGEEPVVESALSAAHGATPSLASNKALRGLRPGGSVYLYLGYKALLGQGKNLGAGYHMIKSGAAMTATLKITPTELQLQTSTPVGELMSVLAISSSQQEAMRKHRNASLANLKKIQDAYAAYVGKMAKHPRTLAELGFSGKNRLVCPLDAAKNKATSAYVLLPGPIKNESGKGRNEIRAYSKNTGYGRLVLNRAGKASVWSENRFIEALAKARKK